MRLHRLVLGGILACIGLVESVKVDLRPCILAKAKIDRDNFLTGEAYMASEFYRGYWGASQVVSIPGSGPLDLTIAANHGKCNVVFVGIEPTPAQQAQLNSYSATFKVRLIYFEASRTSESPAHQTKLGISTFWAPPLYSETEPHAPGIQLTAPGKTLSRVVSDSILTNPRYFGIGTIPVHANTPAVGGKGVIVAEYATQAGVSLRSGTNRPSVAAMTYSGTNGVEELHVFFSLGWFDVESWAWLHFIVEWGTKGVFQGERRFYLGGAVDDLFLKTPNFLFGAYENSGPEYRMTGTDLENFIASEKALNTKYGSAIVTEFPFNANGILEKIQSVYVPDQRYDAPTFPKGILGPVNNILYYNDTDWLTQAAKGLKEEYKSGKWGKDDLLTATLANMDKLHWQSHTMTHLTRDDLLYSDCLKEDQGNLYVAILLGFYFENPNFNWRSITTPKISGLFNKWCLKSQSEHLMTCASGDNTWDGIATDESLLSPVSPYHSLYTTAETNGYPGVQIVPRYATNIYFNCYEPSCLIAENEYIRRKVCECNELDPSIPINYATSCFSELEHCQSGISSFGTFQALLDDESRRITYQILTGRRDKYMFHQSNVRASSELAGKSLLEAWYIDVMASLRKYISFPVMTTKFDDLCANFRHHEDLDASNAVITATYNNNNGILTGLSLSTDPGTSAGYIPLTVPNGMVIPKAGLIIGSDTVYGSDWTLYLSASVDAIPAPAVAPLRSELPPEVLALFSS